MSQVSSIIVGSVISQENLEQSVKSSVKATNGKNELEVITGEPPILSIIFNILFIGI